MSEFLITGCGRSGTGWAAALFTELGFSCSHEGQFSLDAHGPLRGGESSWLAIPHLGSLDPSTPVLRILRDPYEVVWSALYRGFLRDVDEPYARYALNHNPDIMSSDWMGRIIRWVALWDEPLDLVPHRDLRVGGEMPNLVAAVRHATGEQVTDSRISEALGKINVRVNESGRPYLPRVVIDMHPDGALIRKRTWTWKYGY